MTFILLAATLALLALMDFRALRAIFGTAVDTTRALARSNGNTDQ